MILSGRDLQLYIETGKLKIDPITPEQFQQNGIDLVLDGCNQAYGSFYLGVTKETVELPDDLMAFVEIRSSWARRGYIVPPTIVDAGFKGQLTLELVYYGPGNPSTGMESSMTAHGYPSPLHQRFAHLIFARTTGPCVPYNGKYQHQTGITGAR